MAYLIFFKELIENLHGTTFTVSTRGTQVTAGKNLRSVTLVNVGHVEYNDSRLLPSWRFRWMSFNWTIQLHTAQTLYTTQ